MNPALNPGVLLIRADAGVLIGTGHVMRCLALAQAWQDAGGSTVFVAAEITPSVQDRLQSELVEVVRITTEVGSREDSDQTIRLAAKYQATWLVVDGYRFGAAYQSGVKATGLKLLLVDDRGSPGGYAADIILDQYPRKSDNSSKQGQSVGRFLLGPKYILLRREFREWLHWDRPIPEKGGRILIAMGGSDPDKLSLTALRAVADGEIGSFEITIVVGGSNAQATLLQQEATKAKVPVRFLSNSKNMPEVLANSDVAIIAAGATLGEALFMRCAVLSYARNAVQQGILDDLGGEGAVIPVRGGGENLPELLRQVANSKECRAQFSSKGRQIVDGRGAERIVNILLGKENN